MRHAFDASPRPPAPRPIPPRDRAMLLAVAVVLMPYAWAVLTRLNFESAVAALRHARGNGPPPRELPAPLLGSLAGLLMAFYVAWAMPDLTILGLLCRPLLWPAILLPDLAWLVPALAARLARRL